MKVLVVEDNIELNNVMCRYLKKSGFSIDSALDGHEAMDYLRVANYDILILDVMMPEIDGFSLLEKIRERNINTPAIFLTAKDQVEDKIKGLNLGGDDYIVKPFNFDELIARINVVIRRSYGSRTNLLKVGSLELNTGDRTIKVKGNMLDLTSKEFEVLEYLMQNKNRILSRDQIREHSWDFQYEGESNIIDVIIKNIRRKISVYDEQSYIHTKRGMGYVIKDV